MSVIIQETKPEKKMRDRTIQRELQMRGSVRAHTLLYVQVCNTKRQKEREADRDKERERGLRLNSGDIPSNLHS